MKKKKLFQYLFYFFIIVLFAGTLFVFNIFHSLPSINSISDNFQIPSIKIMDRNDRLLYEIIPGEGRNIPLSPEAIPQCMKDATIAVEDKNFYENSGIDVIGIIRAAWINFESDEIISGGSTITQQVARNLLLSEEERFEKTINRKIREAFLALQLTYNYSKDEILAIYLNQIYYGGLSYGIEATSQTYFGKPAQELLLPECALLAGLPQAPSFYNPYTNTEEVLKRQKIVLELMEKEQFITSTERTNAENYSFNFNSSPFPIHAPHFIWLIKNKIDLLYDEGVLDKTQSIIVRTTLDLDYQEIAESVIERQIGNYHTEMEQLDKNVNNAALVVIDPNSGDILTMIGSLDYFNASINGAVNMATSPRQTGSLLKPFIYSLALDPTKSDPWTVATPLLDVSTSFTIQDGKQYIPSNYDQLEHGFVTIREALASSLNIPAVLTLEKVGIEDTADLLKQFGVTSVIDPQNYDLSLVLGGGQINLLELTSAYGTFASGGIHYDNTIILDIQNPEGEILFTPEKSIPQKKIDSRISWLISDILSDDTAREIGFGLNSTLKIDRPVAVKTGTTTNFHDNWTIGYTPDLVVGVWVGNSNFEAMHDVTGLTGAAPIWHETIRTLLQGTPEQEFERPDGIVKVEVCTISGLLPTSACQKAKNEWFLEETVPTETDTVYQEVFLDSLTGTLANDSTPENRKQTMIVLDLPEKAANWARTQGWILLSDLAQGYEKFAPSELLRLISPQPKTTYRIDPNFEISFQQILLEVELNSLLTEVSFWVDGILLDTVNMPPYQTWWQLTVGEHLFWAEGKTSDGTQYSTSEVLITVIDE